MPMTDQISVWCSQCGAQWYCDLEDSPPPDRRRLVLDPILCESCATKMRGSLEARIGRLSNAVVILAVLAERLGKEKSPHWPTMLNEDAQAEMGLLPGDLAEQRSETP
jgi:hypothetical protein